MPQSVHQSRRAVCLAGGLALLLAGCQTRPAHVAPRGPLIQAPLACADFTQRIYFEADSAVITRQAETLLSAAVATARGCRVTGVDIVGLADAPGDAAANLALSRRRADAVTVALHRRGFNQVAFQVAAKGEAGAETAAGQARPVRRRADITFHLAPSPGG